MLNLASKIVLESMYLPNPVAFFMLFQKRNLKVILKKSQVLYYWKIFLNFCASHPFYKDVPQSVAF